MSEEDVEIGIDAEQERAADEKVEEGEGEEEENEQHNGGISDADVELEQQVERPQNAEKKPKAQISLRSEVSSSSPRIRSQTAHPPSSSPSLSPSSPRLLSSSPHRRARSHVPTSPLSTPLESPSLSPLAVNEALLEGRARARTRALTRFQKGTTSQLPEPMLFERPLKEQLKSVPFLLFLLISSIQVLRCNVFLGINRDLLKDLGDTNDNYVRTFTALLPCGFVVAPLIGGSIHKWGFNTGMMITATLGVVYGTLACIRSLELQVLTAIIFVVYRGAVFRLGLSIQSTPPIFPVLLARVSWGELWVFFTWCRV